MTNLFKMPSPTINMPAPTPVAPPPMPDPFNPAAMQAAKNAQATRAGRSSTILTRGATLAGGGMAPAYGGTTLGGAR
jgi:hypothetical protein